MKGKDCILFDGMVDTGENVTNVELVYAGQEVEVTETSASFYNQRQKPL